MSKLDRYIKTIPNMYPTRIQGSFVRGLVEAWAQENENLVLQIEEAKNQIFVNLASDKYLTALGSNVGVSKPLAANLSDDQFRQLVPVMSFDPKQVLVTMYKLLDIFWGPLFSRANITAQTSEPYNFGTSIPLTGTVSFVNDSNTIIGAGTFFIAEITVGQYIKLSTDDNSFFVKVIRIIDNNTLSLATKYRGSAASGVGVVYTSKVLELDCDAERGIILDFDPTYFSDTSAATVDELIELINDQSEVVVADVVNSETNVPQLNLRTDTPGAAGSISVTGGSANIILQFETGEKLISDLPSPTVIYEVNNREIVVIIPDLAPAIGLANSHFFHSDNGIVTAVDNVGKTVTCDFDNQVVADVYVGKTFSQNTEEFTIQSHTTGINNVILQFGAAVDLSRVSIATGKNGFVVFYENWIGSFVYDPADSPYTVQREKTILNQAITTGNIYPIIVADDSSDIPDASGYLVFNFGRANEEGPIAYRGRPTNSSLLIDPGHIFQYDHTAGDTINLLDPDLTPHIPRSSGIDKPVYMVDPQEARLVAQTLIRQIKAAGVVIRFIINTPEYLFNLCRD